jgi:hypothetical protein
MDQRQGGCSWTQHSTGSGDGARGGKSRPDSTSRMAVLTKSGMQCSTGFDDGMSGVRCGLDQRRGGLRGLDR